MAFSTIQGSGGAPDSFVGTSGVDSIVIVNSDGNYFLGAQQSGDNITFQTTGNILYDGVVSNATLKGGQGEDTFTWNSAAATFYSAAYINGNSDRDTLTFSGLDTFLTSTIHGGAANDRIDINAALTSSLVNGNKGIDNITVDGTTIASTIYGGGGNDLIATTAAITNTLISGDLGNEVIAIGGVGVSVDGTTITGGEGVDTITFTNVGVAGDEVLVAGNAGDDTLTLAAASVISSATLEGGQGDDTLTSGGAAAANAVTLIGGAGSDIITGDAQATDRVIYNGLNQGGAASSATSAAAISAGDSIVGVAVAAGADLLTFSAAALNGTAGSLVFDTAAWNMNTAGVNVIDGDADYTAATTSADILADINAALNITGDAGDVGYVVWDGDSAAAGDAVIVQVTLGTAKDGGAGASGNLNAGDQLAVYAIGGAGTEFLNTGINFIA